MSNVVALRPVPTMTAAEFKVKRERLGLTASWVATQLGVYEKTVSRWESGERGVPDKAAALLDEIYKATNRFIMAAIKAVDDDVEDVLNLFTYRLDSQMTTSTFPEFPASWHRAMIGRIASIVEGRVLINYAVDEANTPVST